MDPESTFPMLRSGESIMALISYSYPWQQWNNSGLSSFAKLAEKETCLSYMPKSTKLSLALPFFFPYVNRSILILAPEAIQGCAL